MINFDKACSTDEELLAMVDIEEEMARGNKDPGFNSKKKRSILSSCSTNRNSSTS